MKLRIAAKSNNWLDILKYALKHIDLKFKSIRRYNDHNTFVVYTEEYDLTFDFPGVTWMSPRRYKNSDEIGAWRWNGILQIYWHKETFPPEFRDVIWEKYRSQASHNVGNIKYVGFLDCNKIPTIRARIRRFKLQKEIENG